MTPTTEIVQALVKAGYLEETSAEAASAVLAAALRDDEALADRAEALRDEAEQEQMIAGAREYAKRDTAAGDKKDLRIAESIIQGGIGKMEVDEATLRHAERRIAAACKSTAKSLAHAGLISKNQVKDVAGLIQKTWIESFT